MGAAEFADLKARLLGGAEGTEEACFLLAKPGPSGLTVVEAFHARDQDWARQGSAYLELRDGLLDELIRRAHGLGAALVEMHSHPFDRSYKTRFSWTDERGLKEVAPHVVWRLPNRPYAAFVFGQCCFDSLYWDARRASPAGIVVISLDGVLCEPTGESFTQWGMGL